MHRLSIARNQRLFTKVGRLRLDFQPIKTRQSMTGQKMWNSLGKAMKYYPQLFLLFDHTHFTCMTMYSRMTTMIFVGLKKFSRFIFMMHALYA
jgi:hypothetical protein